MPCLSFSHQLSISIHAPREGGDAEMLEQKSREYISIHAPREGGDGAALHGHHAAHIFQSTPPARGATCLAALGRQLHPLISIHAPREGGDAP